MWIVCKSCVNVLCASLLYILGCTSAHAQIVLRRFCASTLHSTPSYSSVYYNLSGTGVECREFDKLSAKHSSLIKVIDNEDLIP